MIAADRYPAALVRSCSLRCLRSLLGWSTRSWTEEQSGTRKLSDGSVETVEAARVRSSPAKDAQRCVGEDPEADNRSQYDSNTHANDFIGRITANRVRYCLSQRALQAREDFLVNNAKGIIDVVFTADDKIQPCFWLRSADN